MAKQKIQPIRAITAALHAIKRGSASLFVCAVVLLPLILFGMQIKGLYDGRDKRQATPLAALEVRPQDRTNTPIKPFEQPLITVTFDDGWQTIYTEGMPLLQKYGIPTTQYVLSSQAIERDPGYMSYEQIKQTRAGGHEIGCHSVGHVDLTSLGPQALKSELTDCKNTLQKLLNVNVEHFASPFGKINPTTTAAIKQSYQSSRNTAGDITTNEADYNDVNVKEYFDSYNIIAVTIRRETTIAQLQAAIDYTIQNNGWLVLNYHQVENGDTAYGVDMGAFEDQLRTVNKADARIVTIGQFMAAYKEQP